MYFKSKDGIVFHYQSAGKGVPFIFQHGLGGDTSQPFGIFKPPKGFCLLSFDCRGHGKTKPLGKPKNIKIVSFADDLLCFMRHLELSKAIVGGISLGAAVALNFALRFPEHVLGLVLSRPAWLDGPRKENVVIYSLIARLLRKYGPEKGLLRFKECKEYKTVRKESPDAASSLLGQFEHPRALETVIKLEQIPKDRPCRDKKGWEKITIPTLVLANKQDPIHPFGYGNLLARRIPSSEFHEITPKSVNNEKHARDVQKFVEEFLKRHFLKKRGLIHAQMFYITLVG